MSGQVSETSTVPRATRKQQPKSPTSQGELESLSWLASLSGALKTCCLVGISVFVRFSEKTSQDSPSMWQAWSDSVNRKPSKDLGLALGLRTACRNKVVWTRPQAHIFVMTSETLLHKDTVKTRTKQAKNHQGCQHHLCHLYYLQDDTSDKTRKRSMRLPPKNIFPEAGVAAKVT